MAEGGLADSGRSGEAGIDVERLVFVDEMGANTSLAPIHAWSRRGERAHLRAPRREPWREEPDAAREHEL